MTYRELLTALYKEHGLLLPLWRQSVQQSGEVGVFVFSPNFYVPCDTLNDVRFEFWPASRLRTYLRENGSSEEGFDDLEGQIDRASEFLVFILEAPEAGGRRPVHIHRVGAVDQN